MDQLEILKKFATYLLLINPAINPKKIEHLKKSGHCYGMALTDAAMFWLGDIDWWEDLLLAILNWNDDLAALDNTFYSGNSLRNSLTVAFNYISRFQCDCECLEELNLDDLKQLDILNPGSIYEFVANDGEIITIEKHENVCGYLLTQDLNFILDADYLHGKICFLHHNAHTINLSFDGKHWRLYDPNFEHRGAGKTALYFNCGEKNKLIQTIIERMGHSLAIDVLHLTSAKQTQQQLVSPLEQFNQAILQVTNNTTLQLLRNKGIHVMSVHNPGLLNSCVELTQSNITQPVVLAWALPFLDENGWNGLESLAVYAPQVLMKTLTIIEEYSHGAYYLAQALVQKNPKKHHPIRRVVHFAPDTLPIIFRILSHPKQQKISLFDVLTSHSKNRANALHYIAKTAKQYMGDLLDCLANDINGIKILNVLLGDPNKQNQCGILIVAKHAPEYLARIIAMLEESYESARFFSLMLMREDKHNVCALTYIANHHKMLMPKLFELFRKYIFEEKIEREFISILLKTVKNQGLAKEYYGEFLHALAKIDKKFVFFIPEDFSQRTSFAIFGINKMLELAKMPGEIRELLESIKQDARFPVYFSKAAMQEWEKILLKTRLLILALSAKESSGILSELDKKFMSSTLVFFSQPSIRHMSAGIKDMSCSIANHS